MYRDRFYGVKHDRLRVQRTITRTRHARTRAVSQYVEQADDFTFTAAEFDLLGLSENSRRSQRSCQDGVDELFAHRSTILVYRSTSGFNVTKTRKIFSTDSHGSERDFGVIGKWRKE